MPMNGSVITFDHVWKKFQRGERHSSLRDLIPALGRRLFVRPPADELRRQEFWALQDVSFEVRRGEALGIIGPNGAGKSTTLKLLTRIMRPTKGRCSITGRTGALIEVAAGFHPDLTGRENVFLQGAIMGIPRKEMEERFQRIAEFADIGYFIEQPVTTYSSGMYVRLAFACAINVDPDILIIDEALAVGDAMFQRRCYRRIEDFQKSGKTIFFVSHNVGTVTSICTQAMFIDKGKVVQIGKPKEVVHAYSKVLAEREAEYARRMRGEKKEKVEKEEDERLKKPEGAGKEFRFGEGGAEILDIRILNRQDESVTAVETGEVYTVRIKALFKKDMEEPILGFNIKTLNGLEVFGSSTHIAEKPIGPVKAGTTVEAEFEQRLPLKLGNYYISSAVAENTETRRVFHDRRMDTIALKVIGKADFYGLVNMGASIRILCK